VVAAVAVVEKIVQMQMAVVAAVVALTLPAYSLLLTCQQLYQ